MTINPLRPGCFGSALIYRAGAVECAECVLAPECRAKVSERNSGAILTHLLLDKRYGTDRARPTARWFKAKMTPQRPAKTDNTPRALLEGWSARGVNVYHLKHRTNPLEPGPMLHSIFASMIANGAFKPRDIVEDIRGSNPKIDRAKLTALVKNTCDALLLAGILKKEKGVLCLSN